MQGALVIPQNLTGKPLKVVTRDFYANNNVPYLPLSGNTYNDETTLITILSDVISALGGTYVPANDATSQLSTNI